MVHWVSVDFRWSREENTREVTVATSLSGTLTCLGKGSYPLTINEKY